MKFEVIGAPAAAEYLQSGDDVCFGKNYAKSTDACVACRAPVLIDGKIRVMREVCAPLSRGMTGPVDLQRLTSAEVLQMLEQGATPEAIFRKILGQVDPQLGAAAARQLLVDRFFYLSSIKIPTPSVPKTKDLLKESD